MKKQGFKKIFLGGVFAVALALTVTAAQGSESDPLVTLGYLTDQFLPKVLGEVEVKMADRDKVLEDKLQAMVDTYSTDMERKFLKASVGTGEGTAAPGFVAVTVGEGQIIMLSTGSELLLREGTAICVAPSTPGLVDTTDGSILEGYELLRPNHLYLATAEDRGLTAGDTVTVLIRGEYVIDPVENEEPEEPAEVTETAEPAESAEPTETVESDEPVETKG